MKLTEEQKVKLEKCESKEEILKLVDEENIELDDGDLEKINGGGYDNHTKFGGKGGTLGGGLAVYL